MHRTASSSPRPPTKQRIIWPQMFIALRLKNLAECICQQIQVCVHHTYTHTHTPSLCANGRYITRFTASCSFRFTVEIVPYLPKQILSNCRLSRWTIYLLRPPLRGAQIVSSLYKRYCYDYSSSRMPPYAGVSVRRCRWVASPGRRVCGFKMPTGASDVFQRQPVCVLTNDVALNLADTLTNETRPFCLPVDLASINYTL